MLDDVMPEATLDSYRQALLQTWEKELYNRIIPEVMDLVRDCKKLHNDDDCVDFDIAKWKEIHDMRVYLGQDTLSEMCLLTRIKEALKNKDYETASNLQIEMQSVEERLIEVYIIYKKNLFSR